jgi:putative Mg2+ transporter-C (MgtC) family protein
MYYLVDFIKIMIACFLGGLIGQQRQMKGMAMGLRTHIVVCVSAALVQIISIDYNLLNNSNIDAMRLGAQVISGIGFLGMASVIKDGRNIIGLTTAASIWFIACVGLAIGSGIYIPAVIATIVIYLILKDVFKLDKIMEKRKRYNSAYDLEIILRYKENDKNKINDIFNLITQKGVEIFNTNINTEDSGRVTISMTIRLNSSSIPTEILSDLFQLNYIKNISIV